MSSLHEISVSFVEALRKSLYLFLKAHLAGEPRVVNVQTEFAACDCLLPKEAFFGRCVHEKSFLKAFLKIPCVKNEV